MNTRTHIYFASDFHLGYPNLPESRVRENRIIDWLNSIEDTCKELYLLGDIFDFWFEYKWVVPKGNVRFLGKLAEFVDKGIVVYVFKGNHDQWYKTYLEDEIGVVMCEDPVIKMYGDKKFFIHHGHALGSYDKGMNFLHALFTSSFLQWCFARIHPNTAFGMAHRWSARNRKAKVFESSNYLGDNKEWLLLYANEVLKTQAIDYFLFGHRHIALDKKLTEHSRYVNTGNWITNTSYAVFDGKELRLQIFKPNLFPDEKIIE